ncbi:MAG: class II fumarate hydratase [Betaproteobacteria bacterium]|jgi:fumarate hydratase, class II|nr:class II fumarate hydratase [Betaproteobacteria bacterium]MDH5288182.1 class II fumarate hydratase [Betaproteobacteria bacterium]
MTAQRIEHDSLGEVAVDAARLWGAQTQRSIANFPIGVERFRWGRAVVRALGLVKLAAARANAKLGELPADKAALIERAAQEVVDGRLDAEFPLVVFQTGSGTQTNMNANEVIANRAIQLAGGRLGSKAPVHPNDDVNRGQSSNDAFPAAMHVAIVGEARDALYPAVDALRATFARKAAAFADVVMVGRTHLQDATPVTLGQVLGGYATQLGAALDGIRAAERALHALALGATAVGTGLNAHPRFGECAAREVGEATGIPFAPAPDKFAALSAHDDVVAFSASLRTLASALMKIANDVRLYASGPRAGIGELVIPDNEPGSSIMPGKVNPTQAEAMTMVAAQVYGNDLAVAFAGSQGHFQLNAMKPVMLHNVLESIGLLADACRSFDERCARGIEPDRGRIAANLAASLMLVTALNPHVGYEKAAAIAQKAHRDGTSLREAAVALGVAGADFDRWVDPAAMARPGAG